MVPIDQRPGIKTVHMSVAVLYAMRSTCPRRQVGCVLVDAKGRVLATGYNGVPSGHPHCKDTGGAHDRACPGALGPSGKDLDKCEAVHAEQNALLQCKDPDQIDTCYTTTFPCSTCIKLLMQTGCKHIVYMEPYAHDEQAKKLWQSSAYPSLLDINPVELPIVRTKAFRTCERLTPADVSTAIADASNSVAGSKDRGPAGPTPLESYINDRSGHGDKGSGTTGTRTGRSKGDRPNRRRKPQHK